MATAGTVTVNFAAETAKFTAELKKVRTDLKGLKTDTASISGTLGGMGRAATAAFAAFAVTGIAVGIRAILRASEESEAAVSQLNSALKNAGSSAGVSSASLQAFAAQMQSVTTFSDEAVLGVSTVLLSFKGLGPVTEQATKAVLDLSTRMGKDTNSSAILLGRALQDPIKGMTALSRAGVIFDAGQQAVIKAMVTTGDVAGAQQVILRGLEARMGGAATAARDTLGGSLEGLKNQFGDLLEAKTGMPGAVSAVNELSAVLNSPATKAGFANMIAALAKVAEVAIKGVAALLQFSQAAGGLVAKFVVPDAFLSSAAALTKELGGEMDKLHRLEDKAQVQHFIGATNFEAETRREIDIEKAFIETLKVRISLASTTSQAKNVAAPVAAPADVASGVVVDPNAEANAIAAAQALADSVAAAKAANALKKADAKEFADFMVQTTSDMYTELAAQTLAVQEADAVSIQAGQDARIAAVQEEEDFKLFIRQQAADQEMEIFEDQRDRMIVVEQQKLAVQQATISAGVGLLQVWAQKSKAAAIALIVVNRGLQIAQAIQNTHAAAVNALANVPYPYNLAASAQMLTMGYIQVGLIAATGALEIAGGTGGAGGGGSAVRPGSPANPLPVTPVSPGDLEEQKAVQVFINGVVTETVIQQLMDAMDDKFESGVVIIGHGTDQADAIRRGG